MKPIQNCITKVLLTSSSDLGSESWRIPRLKKHMMPFNIPIITSHERFTYTHRVIYIYIYVYHIYIYIYTWKDIMWCWWYRMMVLITNKKQIQNGQLIAAIMIYLNTFSMFTALILAWTHIQCLLPWYLLGHTFNVYCPDTCLDTHSMFTAMILAWRHIQCLLKWYLLGDTFNVYCHDTCLDTFNVYCHDTCLETHSMFTAMILALRYIQCLLPWYLLGNTFNIYCPDPCWDIVRTYRFEKINVIISSFIVFI